jgi:hypothetical protein
MRTACCSLIVALAVPFTALHASSAGPEDGIWRYVSAYEARAHVRGVVRIPSFSRQTGLTCNVCHTSFPQLTAFGRQFKISGYTEASAEPIEQKEGGRTTLSIDRLPPLSAMLITSVTNTNEVQPGTQNWNADFPQELGLFLAGRITPNLGAFVQLTYEPADNSIAIDNLDIRLANRSTVGSHSLVYGLTINNNPTVQDLWNTSPAWSYPYTASGVGPSPAAATAMDGALGQSVLGVGGYMLWNDLVYGEVAGYRSAPQGGANPPDGSSEGTVKGLVPYWRLALQRQFGRHSVELGTYGLVTTQYPSGVSGPTDRYTDLAVDAQYQVPLGGGTVTAHGIWIHEKQTLNASFLDGSAANQTNTLQTLRVDAGYVSSQRIGMTVGVSNTVGDADAVLYAPDILTGSRTGSPNSTALLSEVSWMPWLNTRLGIQYVWWTKFNGATDNYDGSGRAAKDNNTLYLFTWLAF